MAFQTVFKRYELKYMLTTEQRLRVLEAMAPYMKLDQYGRAIIRNLYFDTDTYLLIRRSTAEQQTDIYFRYIGNLNPDAFE